MKNLKEKQEIEQIMVKFLQILHKNRLTRIEFYNYVADNLQKEFPKVKSKAFINKILSSLFFTNLCKRGYSSNIVEIIEPTTKGIQWMKKMEHPCSE